jgi:DNA-binding transcriptional ArsR family regulator
MAATDPDPIVHQPTRLRIMMLLSGLKEADFNFLLNTLGLTKGNLSVQSAKLEEAGYIEITKAFEGKIPRTTYRLAALGRQRLAEYWQAMDSIRTSAQAGE